MCQNISKKTQKRRKRGQHTQSTKKTQKGTTDLELVRLMRRIHGFENNKKLLALHVEVNGRDFSVDQRTRLSTSVEQKFVFQMFIYWYNDT